MREEVHEFHVVLKDLQPLASVVGEAGGVLDDGVNTIETHQEVGVLADKGVVFGGVGVAGEGGLVEVEDGPEVLDGRNGDLVGGVYGHTLTETCEDVLQLLEGLAGLGEDRAKQLPRLSHALHLGVRRERREIEFMRVD